MVRVQKGFGYHLDLFVLALLIIVCSLLGLPWFVAATVRSVTHVRSLIKLSDVSAPGERPEMLGVRSSSSSSSSSLCTFTFITHTCTKTFKNYKKPKNFLKSKKDVTKN